MPKCDDFDAKLAIEFDAKWEIMREVIHFLRLHYKEDQDDRATDSTYVRSVTENDGFRREPGDAPVR